MRLSSAICIKQPGFKCSLLKDTPLISDVMAKKYVFCPMSPPAGPAKLANPMQRPGRKFSQRTLKTWQFVKKRRRDGGANKINIFRWPLTTKIVHAAANPSDHKRSIHLLFCFLFFRWSHDTSVIWYLPNSHYLVMCWWLCFILGIKKTKNEIRKTRLQQF